MQIIQMQTAQPLGMRAAKAGAQARLRTQTEAPVELSFHSAITQAKSRLETRENAQPEAAIQAEEALAEPDAQAPDALDADGHMAQQMTWAERLEAMMVPKQAQTTEGLARDSEETQQEQPGEDVPAEFGATMAMLGALPMQQPESEIPAEPALLSTDEGQAFILTESAPGEGPRKAPTPAAGQSEQHEVEPEQENTLPVEAPQLSATRAQAAEASGKFIEKDMQNGHAKADVHAQIETEISQAPRREAHSPGTETGAALRDIQAQPDAVVDLSSADGETLPAEDARRILGENLFEQVQSALSFGKQDLFLRLKPESLGEMVIHLTMTQDGLKAQVRTSSESVRQLVAEQLYQVENALRLRDIPVVQMEVIYDQAAMADSFFGQNRQSWQGGEHTRGRGRGTLIASAEESAVLYEAALAIDTAAQIAGEGVVYSA